MPRPAVPYRVDRGLANDAQSRMAHAFGHPGRRDVHVDGDVDFAEMRGERLAHGIGEVFRVQGVVPEPPQAFAQFAPARGEDAFRGLDFAGVELHRRAGQRLRDGVVDFRGEPRALGGLELRQRTCGAFVEEFPSALFGKMPERPVPDQNGGNHEQEDDDRDDEPRGRPPGRTREDGHVVRAVRHEPDSVQLRVGGENRPVFGIQHASSRHLHAASRADRLRRFRRR